MPTWRQALDLATAELRKQRGTYPAGAPKLTNRPLAGLAEFLKAAENLRQTKHLPAPTSSDWYIWAKPALGWQQRGDRFDMTPAWQGRAFPPRFASGLVGALARVADALDAGRVPFKLLRDPRGSEAVYKELALDAYKRMQREDPQSADAHPHKATPPAKKPKPPPAVVVDRPPVVVPTVVQPPPVVVDTPQGPAVVQPPPAVVPTVVQPPPVVVKPPPNDGPPKRPTPTDLGEQEIDDVSADVANMKAMHKAAEDERNARIAAEREAYEREQAAQEHDERVQQGDIVPRPVTRPSDVDASSKPKDKPSSSSACGG